MLSLALFEETKYPFILRGWIPSHLTLEVEKGLLKEFCVTYKHESATSNDNCPILLKTGAGKSVAAIVERAESVRVKAIVVSEESVVCSSSSFLRIVGFGLLNEES